MLKAAGLNALPQVFYGGEQGLDLVVNDSGKYVPNVNAPIAKEILDFLKREHSYGNKVTGKILEDHFGGIGYGWERDMLRLVLAVLLRAGAMEVTYQGRRFRGHQDPQSRVPFTNNQAFRAASFAPREAIGLKSLTTAVEQFEALTGSEVDVEEAAIATAFKKLAEDETRLVLPLEATARANRLAPLIPIIAEYRSYLDTVAQADTDDCVRILAGEGVTFQKARDRIRQIQRVLGDEGLERVRQARLALDQMLPSLQLREGNFATASEELAALLNSEAFGSNLDEIQRYTDTIGTAYQDEYSRIHDIRREAYSKAIGEIKNHSDWPSLAPEVQTSLLVSLVQRACGFDLENDHADLDHFGVVCRRCHATIDQMGSDLAAVDGFKAQAVARYKDLITPSDVENKVARVRLVDFFSEGLDSPGAVEDALSELREHLLKLIEDGKQIVVE